MSVLTEFDYKSNSFWFTESKHIEDFSVNIHKLLFSFYNQWALLHKGSINKTSRN